VVRFLYEAALIGKVVREELEEFGDMRRVMEAMERFDFFPETS
jgi:hypothetical protein